MYCVSWHSSFLCPVFVFRSDVYFMGHILVTCVRSAVCVCGLQYYDLFIIIALRTLDLTKYF
jgi:hypothetical protein